MRTVFPHLVWRVMKQFFFLFMIFSLTYNIPSAFADKEYEEWLKEPATIKKIADDKIKRQKMAQDRHAKLHPFENKNEEAKNIPNEYAAWKTSPDRIPYIKGLETKNEADLRAESYKQAAIGLSSCTLTGLGAIVTLILDIFPIGSGFATMLAKHVEPSYTGPDNGADIFTDWFGAFLIAGAALSDPQAALESTDAMFKATGEDSLSICGIAKGKLDDIKFFLDPSKKKVRELAINQTLKREAKELTEAWKVKPQSTSKPQSK